MKTGKHIGCWYDFFRCSNLDDCIMLDSKILHLRQQSETDFWSFTVGKTRHPGSLETGSRRYGRATCSTFACTVSFHSSVTQPTFHIRFTSAAMMACLEIQQQLLSPFAAVHSPEQEYSRQRKLKASCGEKSTAPSTSQSLGLRQELRITR